MKKRKALSLLLSLTLLLSLALPATTAYAEDGSSNKGMEISKTATANKDGSYTITLEAYATGSKVISEVTEDVPTDIVLVLDQSGSMDDAFSRATEDSWVSYGKQINSENHDLRMNNNSYYATKNLYYKQADGSYVEVSVDRTSEPVQDYVAWSYARNSGCYNSSYDLYADTEEGYKEVTVTRSSNSGNRRTYTYTYTLNDGTTVTRTSTGDNGTPPYTIYRLQDTYEYAYEYYYTINGVRTTIGEQSRGEDTVFNVEFYKKVSAGTSITALEALQNAVRNFAGAVETKAAGKDGVLGTDDDINHRIAVVGYASRANSSNPWINTELFIGANQHNYNIDAKNYYNQAFQDMNTPEGQANIQASIGALDANGATYTNYGMEMANGILDAYPLGEKEQRNRVIILFTDGFPGRNTDDFDSTAANTAISHANTAKGNGTTVYTVGIFSGADATSVGNVNGNNTQKANWFMQRVSSNNGMPQSPSYYLSAADAGSLNSIFQQISSNIETGGTSSTLTADAVVKDIISPQFTLPAGTTAANITVETYACTGKNANGDYTWSNNNSTMGATASISGDQVNVTGFNFSENYVGTVTEGNSVTYRGHKLVISFKVQPKADFLGGNEVYTNTSAGIYENGSAENPLLTFDRPTVNVPIKDVTVTAKDKNVYLKGEVTADQLKDGAEISVGNVTLDLTKENYGLESWQTEYVDITVTVKDKDNNVISDKLEGLKEDTTYTVEVTVSPKNEGTSTAAKGDAATAKTGINDPAANIYVFKPELTFKDSTAYYGESVPANNNYSGNKVGSETWKHGDTASTDAGVTMLGIKPTLDISYTPDESKLEGGKYTKQDVPVSATVKIGTENVNEHTTFVHQDCDPACGWTAPANPGAPAFLIHIQTCTLRITKQGGAGDESYVFDVYKDGKKYSEVTVWGNSTEILVELPIGTYTISENQGWSWRYYANNGGSAALTTQNPTGSITCVNTKNNNQWLNGFSEVVRNIFGTNH